MSENGSNPLHRRQFIQQGAAVAAGAGVFSTAASAAQVSGEKAAAAKTADLPRRVLGKTGEHVTIVNAGTWRAPRFAQPLASPRVQPWSALF